ncbi:DUF2066 domain-containing protein [Pseudoalteromonas fenneropenaei]|uniref:DUF2066 domain-containing protein n=1 Tax=Pseudoalteromonas fenneropenaei TaxID=1737459 RepID=A0ABV7CPP7_9GAMM
MIFRLCALLLLLTFQSSAIEIKDLYQSSVVVADKSRQARVQAGQDAMLNVLKKLTGKDDTANHPLIRQALRDYSQYLIKYEYLEAGGDKELRAQYVFEASKLNALVKDAGWSFWGNRRPQIVLWLAIEDNKARDFVTQESYPQLERLIYDKSQEWGIPVLLPLLDLQDRSQVGVAEVWGNFSAPIEQASRRYNAERIITARMYQQPFGNGWLLEWRYTNASAFEPQQLVGDQQVIISQMMETLASSLMQEFAVNVNELAEPLVSIITVKQLKGFRAIELAKRRIQSISTVKDVTVEYRAGDSVQYRVRHVSQVAELKRALSLETALTEYIDPSVFYHVEDAQSLIYNWVAN